MTEALARPLDEAPRANNEHRRRLLEAMAETVARKGFADTTIADLASHARVSRRTFYEHFSSKGECLIALYEAASRQALSVLVSAINPQRDWREQVEAALGAYLTKLASNPVLLSTLFIEILALGPQGLRARRHVTEELANFLLALVNAPAAKPRQALPAALAMGVVGAINELVLQAIERNEAERLDELTPTATRLVWTLTALASER